MVLPFVGIEMLAVGAAFLCYGCHAADFERIAITPRHISVEQVEGAQNNRWELDPRSSHLQVESSGSQWGERVHVYLLAPGITLELGRHLLDARRSQLRRELCDTLMHARAAAN